MTNISDQPQSGYYAIEVDGRFVYAFISEGMWGGYPPKTFIAEIEGRPADAIDVWRGENRTRISAAEYDSMKRRRLLESLQLI